MISAPERSLFRKVQVVLNECKGGEARTIDEFCELIRQKSPLSFTYHKVNKAGRTEVATCKIETIKKSVQLCIDLKFIKEGTMQLTGIGSNTTNRSIYHRELKKAVKSDLRRHEIDLKDLKEEIEKIYSKSNGEQIPTWNNIYARFEKLIDEKKFHKYLNLLVITGGLRITQKRLFLP